MEAFTSRLSIELHLGQVQSRTFNVSSLLIYPQQLQVFEDGTKRPILRIFLPYQSALYSNIETKVDQLTSLIACAKLWFLTIFFTAKVSSAIVWFSLMSLLESLCKKSLRLFTTFSCSSASRFLVRLPLYFEYLRCTYFNLLCALRRYLGLSNSFPSDETRYVLIPKSIPTVVFSSTFAFDFIASPVSQSIDTKYLPVGVRDIVACLITPLIGRCRTIPIPFLNFGIISLLFSKTTFCGILKLPLFDFFLNFGKLFCPLKKAVYALSKLVIDCCKDWLLISFSHSHSVLRSFNWLCKAKQLKLTLLPAQAMCLHSKAKLYTKRLAPICLLSRMDCSFVGDKRYLKAFSINYKYTQIYKSLKKNQSLFKKLLSFCWVAFIPQSKAGEWAFAPVL